MDLRGAKSNVMSLIRTYWNRNCPLGALVGAWQFESLEFTVFRADRFRYADFPLLIAVSLRQITSVWPTIRQLSRVGASEQDALVRPHLRLARYPPQAGTVMVTALPDQVVFNEARNEGAGRRPEHVDAQADVWDLEDS
jgi:hypothetical protein